MDLPAWEIFEKFEGTSADRAVIAEYAAKDTVLPLHLLSKLCILENTFEMANATYCPVTYVIQRGQQIKVYSVLMRKARAMGYACPDGVGIGVQGKFTGATVLNADRGAYLDDIVSGLDFAALYPSIIRYAQTVALVLCVVIIQWCGCTAGAGRWTSARWSLMPSTTTCRAWSIMKWIPTKAHSGLRKATWACCLTS